ncbi:MAG: tRNA (adenosine(37)-N6)-threonylcarbamoyltransferase complex dimerization subunit type 1 TsaB [Blastocatellia bacterium]
MTEPLRHTQTAEHLPEPVVLAVDTSSPQAGLALTAGENLLAEISDHSGRPHSQTLFQNLEQLLSEASLTLEQVEAFAVVTGPGSFTGLRVGMAAVRGLAHTLGRPAIGVTTLDAWALAAGAVGRILVMIDAMRGEVFCGLREIVQSERGMIVKTLAADCSAAPEKALAQLRPDLTAGHLFVTGSGARRYEEILKRELDDSPAAWSLMTGKNTLAVSVARYGAQLLTAGMLPEVHAYYLRPSDAEIKFPAAS